MRRCDPVFDKVVTVFVYPPIPVRCCDWAAYYDDDEPNDNGHMASGHGATEAEAVLDLIENHYRGVECSRDLGIS